MNQHEQRAREAKALKLADFLDATDQVASHQVAQLDAETRDLLCEGLGLHHASDATWELVASMLRGREMSRKTISDLGPFAGLARTA